MNSQKEKNLVIRGITKKFGEFTALKTVSLEVSQKEFFTLVGPSGCGKTTLLRIIAGLEMPSSGAIILSGQDITALPATRRQVNTVFQSYALFPHLTIFENVAFGLRSRRFKDAEVKKRVGDTLELLEMGAMRDRNPDQLSGGQRQRVAAARMFVREPQLLVFDDLSSALDVETERLLWARLFDTSLTLSTGASPALASGHGNPPAVIAVSHRRSVLQRADRIVLMEDGAVAGVGTLDELLKAHPEMGQWAAVSDP